MATLQIGTESKRASIHQRLTDIYAQFQAGGAFYVQKQLVTDGSFDEMSPSQKNATHTIDPGFKTLMMEQATLFKMALNPAVVTTTLRTSVNGPLDTTKYSP